MSHSLIKWLWEYGYVKCGHWIVFLESSVPQVLIRRDPVRRVFHRRCLSAKSLSTSVTSSSELRVNSAPLEPCSRSCENIASLCSSNGDIHWCSVAISATGALSCVLRCAEKNRVLSKIAHVNTISLRVKGGSIISTTHLPFNNPTKTLCLSIRSRVQGCGKRCKMP